jgi:hypothetical protein
MEPLMNVQRPATKIAALYPSASAADTAAFLLRDARVGRVDVMHIGDGRQGDGPREEASSESSAPGAASLYVSAPVVAPLVILGYGALVGGAPGAVRDLDLAQPTFDDLINDALDAGFYVLMVHARDKQKRRQARDVLDRTIAGGQAHN